MPTTLAGENNLTLSPPPPLLGENNQISEEKSIVIRQRNGKRKKDRKQGKKREKEKKEIKTKITYGTRLISIKKREDIITKFQGGGIIITLLRIYSPATLSLKQPYWVIHVLESQPKLFFRCSRDTKKMSYVFQKNLRGLYVKGKQFDQKSN